VELLEDESLMHNSLVQSAASKFFLRTGLGRS